MLVQAHIDKVAKSIDRQSGHVTPAAINKGDIRIAKSGKLIPRRRFSHRPPIVAFLLVLVQTTITVELEFHLHPVSRIAIDRDFAIIVQFDFDNPIHRGKTGFIHHRRGQNCADHSRWQAHTFRFDLFDRITLHLELHPAAVGQPTIDINVPIIIPTGANISQAQTLYGWRQCHCAARSGDRSSDGRNRLSNGCDKDIARPGASQIKLGACRRNRSSVRQRHQDAPLCGGHYDLIAKAFGNHARHPRVLRGKRRTKDGGDSDSGDHAFHETLLFDVTRGDCLIRPKCSRNRHVWFSLSLNLV